ncbi:streptogramin lyase [Bradyrhizobium sp. USDA 4461]
MDELTMWLVKKQLEIVRLRARENRIVEIVVPTNRIGLHWIGGTACRLWFQAAATDQIVPAVSRKDRAPWQT